MKLSCRLGKHQYDVSVDLGKPTSRQLEEHQDKNPGSGIFYSSNLHVICCLCGKKKLVEFSGVKYTKLPELLLK